MICLIVGDVEVALIYHECDRILSHSSWIRREWIGMLLIKRQAHIVFVSVSLTIFVEDLRFGGVIEDVFFFRAKHKIVQAFSFISDSLDLELDIIYVHEFDLF